MVQWRGRVTNQLEWAFHLDETSAWVDFIQLVSTGAVTSQKIIDLNPPEGMVFIPGGNFTVSDELKTSSNAMPMRSVCVDGFYMGKFEVTWTQWRAVYTWAIANGYVFDHVGDGKDGSHPVHTVSWYDVVTWCNARSEKEGKTPCYDLNTWRLNLEADGYRLPTEAEWEKAARGGERGKRFGWGDTIDHSQANYYSSTADLYDISSTRGYHPLYENRGWPCTSPVGAFPPNAYGLYDMAGNIWEWCGDWVGSEYYRSSPSENPEGPATGEFRVLRGGCWFSIAWYCRSVNRYWFKPTTASNHNGFRVCLPAR